MQGGSRLSDLEEGTAHLLDAGGMPLHRQLFLVLRDQIQRGALVPGQRLPTEQELGEQFEVSRITVRRALQDLADQQFVMRKHGRGTFVLDHAPDTPPSSGLTLMDSMRKAQLETSVEVLEYEARRPPPTIVGDLDLEQNEEVLYVLRLRRDKSTGEPLIISESWLPESLAKTVTRKSLSKKAMFELLETAGHKIGRVIQELTAEIADPVRARLLQTSIGAPVFRVSRVFFDVNDRPVHRQSLFMSPLRSRIITEIQADRIDTMEFGMIAHDVTRPGQ